MDPERVASEGWVTKVEDPDVGAKSSIWLDPPVKGWFGGASGATDASCFLKRETKDLNVSKSIAGAEADRSIV